MMPALWKNSRIIYPREDAVPGFRMTPFCRDDLVSSLNLEFDNYDKALGACEAFFNKRHGCEKKIAYTMSGRDAIALALQALGLSKTDEIAILTTSGNYYISSCVTKEIEKICCWKRDITSKSKAILVNHEFGYPYKNIEELKQHNLPIIEDCAYSFNSNNVEKTVGLVGDFIVYSFPKFFSMQFGGALVYSNNYCMVEDIPSDLREILLLSLNANLKLIADICDKRNLIYEYYEEKFHGNGNNGIMPRFKKEKHYAPGAYLFSIDKKIDLPKLKDFYYRHGVECSVFYGENAFYLPLHQNIYFEHVDYFMDLFNYFRANINDIE